MTYPPPSCPSQALGPLDITDAPPDAAHMRVWLALIRERIQLLLANFPESSAPLFGLIPEPDSVLRKLTQHDGLPAPSAQEQHLQEILLTQARRAESTGRPLRLSRLTATFQLTAFDIDVLMIALAPHIDHRFTQAYAYFHDPAAATGVTAQVALRLARGDCYDPAHLGRLTSVGPLCRHGLLLIEGHDEPPPARVLRVPDRIRSHLLGDDSPATAPSPHITLGLPPWPACLTSHTTAADHLRAIHSSGPTISLLRHNDPATALTVACQALTPLTAPNAPVILDLTHALLEPAARCDLFTQGLREAHLRDSPLVIGPLDDSDCDHLGTLLNHDSIPLPPHTILTAARTWPSPYGLHVIETTLPPLTFTERATLWERLLSPGSTSAQPHSHDTARSLAIYQLTATQIRDTHAWARHQSGSTDTPLTHALLTTAVRRHNTGRLRQLATHLVPDVSTDDLILDAGTTDQITALIRRVRHRDTVIDTWNMRPGAGYGRGITALLTGESGTGKTLAAEVIAAEIGLDLYVVNIATVVDKYIGETEKNLKRIFEEAEGVNGVLLFDEADALFGKRSDVKDAHDRYSNIETAYLLQTIEKFDGITLLTTNLAANIDSAFLRRLDATIIFPAPDAAQRLRLWKSFLGKAPCDPGLDLTRIAADFDLTGGAIRSCALTAAYAAAAAETPINSGHIFVAIRAEYRKLRKIVDPRAFDLAKS